jgi:copper transport protein
VLTGLAQSLLEVRPLSALFDTTYGLVLVAKLALVGIVLAVALLSRRQVPVIADAAGPYDAAPYDTAPYDAESYNAEPADGDSPDRQPVDFDSPEADSPEADSPEADSTDAGEPAESAAAARRLRRLVLVEAAVAVAVIGITSVLVQLTPARTAAESAEAGDIGVQSVTLRDERLTLTVDLVPARVGINELHMYALTPDLRPLTIVEWRVVASASAAGLEGVEAAVLPITPDHAIGQIGLPAAGSWTFTFTLRLDEFTNGIVTTTFTVRS